MKVAVVGCGAMGAAASWRLSKRGAEVVAFDRYSPPHDKGSTHGDSRITRTAYLEGAFYVPLLQETFPMWRELEAATGAELLTMTGLLTLGALGSPSIEATLASAREHDLAVRTLDTADLRKLYPGHIVADGEVGVLDAQAGFLRPEKAVEAMARGLDVRRNVVVNALVPEGDGVEVVTDAGRERFDAAVIAAGPWVRALLPWLPVTVERQVMVWLAIAADESFAPSRFPVWLRQGAPEGDIYGFPTLDGRSIKLGGHHGGEAATPETVRRGVSDADLDPLRLFVTRHMRGVTRHVVKSAVCLYTNSPDEHFIVDLHPDSKRIVVLSPCSGHGFKFAPVMGDIAADLVLDGATRRDISRFALSRFAKTG
ncbi:MAG TPA: N-methyl-L-tryptophan oxidase [Candidatus Dormibacteraeota bacterium]|nr:N-methyl-L-tryptophan oxidase [Candidatus Dormibacteraeota bacterium]